jgi:hypothetical protein
VIIHVSAGVAVGRRNAGSVLVAVIVDDGRRVRWIPFRFRTNVGVCLYHAVACGVATAAGVVRVPGIRGIGSIGIITTATRPDTDNGEQAQGS